MASVRSVSLMFVCVFVVGVMSSHSMDAFGHVAFRYYVPLVEDVYPGELESKTSAIPVGVASSVADDQDHTALASIAVGVGVGIGIVACSVFAGVAYAVLRQYRDVEQFDWEGNNEFSQADLKLKEDDNRSVEGEKEDSNEDDYDAWTSIRQVDSDEEESEDDEESTADDNEDTDALQPCSSNSQIIVQCSSMRKANSFGG